MGWRAFFACLPVRPNIVKAEKQPHGILKSRQRHKGIQTGTVGAHVQHAKDRQGITVLYT